MEPSLLLSQTVDIVDLAAQAIMSFYKNSFSVTDKSPDNPVTDADIAADSILKEQLLELLPEAGWLSEETADSHRRLDKEYCWVVDPLDGTKEFVMGIPEFSISTALVLDGQPLLAVISNPVSGELFTAIRNQGTTYNGNLVKVSGRESLTGSRVDASRSERVRGEFEPFEKLVDVNTVGSIAYKLARVAAGIADATWSRGPKNEWDICAGVLLITESGGVCVDLDGEPLRFNQPYPKVNGIVADNGLLHEQVMNILAPHRSTARLV